MGHAEEAYACARHIWDGIEELLDNAIQVCGKSRDLVSMIEARNGIDYNWPAPESRTRWFSRIDPDEGDEVRPEIVEGEENIKRAYWEISEICEDRLTKDEIDDVIGSLSQYRITVERIREKVAEERNVRRQARRLLRRSAREAFKQDNYQFEYREWTIKCVSMRIEQIASLLRDARLFAREK